MPASQRQGPQAVGEPVEPKIRPSSAPAEVLLQHYSSQKTVGPVIGPSSAPAEGVLLQ